MMSCAVGGAGTRAMAGSHLAQSGAGMRMMRKSAGSSFGARVAVPLAPNRLVAARGLGAGVSAQLNEVVNAVSQHSSAHGVDLQALDASFSQLLYSIADADLTAASDAAEAADNGGFLGPIVGGLEFLLKVLDGGLESAGVPYSYGFAIIALTVLVKVFTFPLSKQQVESTIAMQKIQPKVKALQTKYANDKERLQMETAKLYQDAGVNPLAGCLPTLATLPVFIGLYRALTNVADEGLLTDGFFWIPSLAGPTSIAERTSGDGFSWLTPLVDGAPPIGWHDALAYLVLPVVLTISQFVSQALMSPTPDGEVDESQKQSQAILKFLPFMIGWFSLNVPSGLTLYWFTNNILTTAQTLYLRKAGASPEPAMAGGGSASASSAAPIDVEVLEPANPNGKGTQPGLSRRERREQKRAEERGKRFAARKAAENKGKEKQTPEKAPETVADTEEESTPSA